MNENDTNNVQTQPEEQSTARGGSVAASFKDMTPKRAVLFATAVLLAAIIFAGVLFFAIFFGMRSDPVQKYALAQRQWNEATVKSVRDQVTIELDVGALDEDGEYPLTLNVALNGSRTYTANTALMSYNAVVMMGALKLLNANLEITSDAENFALVLESAADSSIKFSRIEYTMPTKELNAYLTFDFAQDSFYNTENVSVEKNGDYVVKGDQSISYVLYQIAPLLSRNFNFDTLSMLESWLTLGDAAGTMSFSPWGKLESMTSTQTVQLLLPWEDAEYLSSNIDYFPEAVMSIIKTKSFSLAGLALDLESMMPNGLEIYAEVGTYGIYSME